MQERDSFATFLGNVIAAIIAFAIFAPLIRRRQKREEDKVAKRVGKNGFTPLMYAAVIGDSKLLDQLLTAGVDANAVDENGETALLHAVWANQVEAAEILLKAGADPRKPSNHGKTPADLALNIGSKMERLFHAGSS